MGLRCVIADFLMGLGVSGGARNGTGRQREALRQLKEIFRDGAGDESLSPSRQLQTKEVF